MTELIPTEVFKTKTNEWRVRFPSGAEQVVLSKDEGEFVINRTTQYLQDNALANIADLANVERLVMLELFCKRYSDWITKKIDEAGDEIDDKDIQKRLNETSNEARQLSKVIGLDKAARDRNKQSDDAAAYLPELLARAKQFVWKRRQEFDEALNLSHELMHKFEMYGRLDDLEKIELEHRFDDLLDWVVKVYIPRFKAIDEAFITDPHDGQKWWIQNL